jgi:flagellar motor switch protein FliN/FliY
MDVSLNMKIEIGRTKLSIDQVLRLREGSVVELDKVAGDPVDILVNNRLVAKGEILVLNEAFCIRITEIVSPKERLARGL